MISSKPLKQMSFGQVELLTGDTGELFKVWWCTLIKAEIEKKVLVSPNLSDDASKGNILGSKQAAIILSPCFPGQPVYGLLLVVFIVCQ